MLLTSKTIKIRMVHAGSGLAVKAADGLPGVDIDVFSESVDRLISDALVEAFVRQQIGSSAWLKMWASGHDVELKVVVQ